MQLRLRYILCYFSTFIRYCKVLVVKGDFMRQAMLENVLVDLDTLTKPEIMNLNRRRNFSCVKCAKPVIFKNGTRKRPHFAHDKNAIAVGQPESAAHMLVKHSLARWLERQGCPSMVERRFPEIDRIADVYFEYLNRPYVLEIQKSPISDTEYQQRIADYQKIGATVLWVFLGPVTQNKNLYQLPPVMLGRNSDRLFHFCIRTAKLTIFEQLVFVTGSKIYAQVICKPLGSLQISHLIDSSQDGSFFEDSWLDIKHKFRERGWHYAGRSERKLIEQCLLRGFNLALLPTEIGWPVVGNAIRKPLFIWQAYVLVTIIKHFTVGNKFALPQLMQFLSLEFKISVTADTKRQVENYLAWLVMFGVLMHRGRYFEYKKQPKISSMTEENRSRDEQFVNAVVKLWKR